MKQVAIIGGGLSGISVAYNLWKKGIPGCNITLFETRDKLGGDSRPFHHPSLTRSLDVGFPFFNQHSNPLLLHFFRELDVQCCDSEMSHSVENEFFVWKSPQDLWSNIKAFLQAPIQMFWFLWNLYGFFRDASSYVKDVIDGKCKHITIDDFFKTRNYRKAFVNDFLMPYIASLFFSKADSIGDYDSFAVFNNLENNNLLNFGSLQWKSLKYPEESYVSAFLHKCKPVVHLKCKIRSLKQCENLKWRINNSDIQYDAVVIGHYNTNVKDIEIEAIVPGPSDFLNKLATIRYVEKYAILHQDTSLMPISKSNWSSQNFKHGIVTYWENLIQPIGSYLDIFVSIVNKEERDENLIDKTKYLAKPFIMSHPTYCQRNFQTTEEIQNMQGQHGIYVCKASIFLEDTYRSGYEVARLIVNRYVDMYESIIKYNAIPRITRSTFKTMSNKVATAVMRKALRSIVKKGCIGIQTREHGTEFFGESGVSAVLVNVKNPCLVWKCMLKGDIGFAEAYIDECMEVNNLPLLLFYLVINTYPAPQSQSCWLPFVYFFSKFSRNIIYNRRLKNTVSSAKRNIIEHYDLGNDFFETFLDTTMTYSSGIFLNASDDLETAQLQKYDRLLDQLKVVEGDHVLEIGCGWGGMAVRAVTTRKCSMTCITISPEQAKYCRERVIKNNLQDSVAIHEIDFRDIETAFDQVKFDAVVSIEMIEAIGPDNFDNYFRMISRVLKPGGKVAIQVITRFEDQYNKFKSDTDFLTEYIFPGGCLPSLGVITQTASRCGLVISGAYNISKSYAKTLEIWREKFNLATIQSDFKFDKRFIRIWNMYFSMSQASFEASNVQDFQIVFEPMRSNSYIFK